MMQEQRRFTRWFTKWQAKLELEGEAGPVECMVRDINYKGVQISSAVKLPADTFLRLTLALTEEFVIDDAEVWVVWHKAIMGKNLYGLYFAKIKDKDKEKIYRFVFKYFPKQVHQQTWQGIKKGGEIMENGTGTQDRRVFERIPASIPVKILDLNSNQEGVALTEDISAKGLGFSTNLALQPSSNLELWLEIPDKGDPLYTRGNVVWSQPQGEAEYRAGIELEGADLMGLSRVLRAP
ncbi:PilZ domain-containing protein [Candidatus Omnitrophota bacterium]